jgi:hypothetical protein
MLNKRHKAALFLTLVLTGSALLAGATLNEALGILILGIALAWVLGSKTIIQTYDWIRNVPGKGWPWIRSLFFMALGGSLMVAVAYWSNLNAFLVAATQALFGMLISGMWQLPTQKNWAKVIVWMIGAVAFFFAAVGTMELVHLNDHAERIGELVPSGIIALSIGRLWLIKGWNLVVAGISASLVAEPETATNPGSKQGTVLLYISLIAGVLALTLWLALLAFSAFSDAVFAHQNTATANTSLFSPVLFLMLLAWWPYTCFERIIRREPNVEPHNLKRHKRTVVAMGALFVPTICLAITFGIQNGGDRRTTAEIEEGTKDFQSVAVKIGSIKSRELKTTKNYIDAYEEIEPLLSDFDDRLSRFTGILKDSQARDKNRGPLNIQRLYPNSDKQLLWDMETFDLLRKDSELTRKEVLVTRQMAALPDQEQIDFWNKNFLPLAQQEEDLRQKLAALQKNNPLGAK